MKEFLFKEGDRVMVKPNLSCSKSYKMLNSDFENSVSGSMEKFRGQYVTIYRVASRQYRIEEDSQYWGWTDEMFVLKDNTLTIRLMGGDKNEV